MNIKSISTLLVLQFLMVFHAHSQKLYDAWMFSNDDELYSTGRYRSMSGAFSALGGDFSASLDNPASGAVFSNNQAGISVAPFTSYKNVNSLVGNESETDNSKSSFNQLGFVIVLNNMNQKNLITKLTFGFNYNKTVKSDNSVFYNSTNPNSISDSFLNYANGTPLGLLPLEQGESVPSAYQYLGGEDYSAQQAFLAYHTYLISPVNETNENNQYTKNAIYPGGVNQSYRFTNTVFDHVFSFNLAAKIKENLYVGLNLNNHQITQARNVNLSEKDFAPDSPIKQILYDESISMPQSDGFSMQLGAIFKANQNLRLSASYSSPTWYDIRERQLQDIETQNSFVSSGGSRINPGIYNLNNYGVITPYKISTGFAYVFETKGLISFQYDVKDYKSTTFLPKGIEYYTLLNNEIRDTFQVANSFRLGGEYLIKNFQLRAGMRYRESPFKDESKYGGSLKGYSLGAGYKFFGTNSLNISFDSYRTESATEIMDGSVLGYGKSKSVFNTFLISYVFLF